MTNSIQTQNKPAAPATFSAFMTNPGIKQRLYQMMAGKEAENFITSVVSSVTTNPALQECDHMSIFSSALQGQTLKLNPSPVLGHFYMVPFNNRKTGKKEAKFILGYKGYIQLAIRSGQYKKINALELKHGEVISWCPLSETLLVKMIEDEEQRESTPTSHFYAIFEYLNGYRKAICWSYQKMLLHADKYSAAFSKDNYKQLQETGKVLDSNGKDITWKMSSYWYSDFNGMGMKTLIRQLISKWGIMSIEMQQAFEMDIQSEQDQETQNREPVQDHDIDLDGNDIFFGTQAA